MVTLADGKNVVVVTVGGFSKNMFGFVAHMYSTMTQKLTNAMMTMMMFVNDCWVVTVGGAMSIIFCAIEWGERSLVMPLESQTTHV